MQLNLSGVLVDGTTGTTVPTRQDIVVYRGVDTSVQVTVKNTAGTAVNLTGYSATLKVKDRLLPAQGNPQLNVSYAATLTDPTNGVVTFTIPGTDLKNMNLVGYWYDVFIASATSKRDEVVPTGTMTVNAAVGA
jgi:hypothetical protein